jgi:hypothetical protein
VKQLRHCVSPAISFFRSTSRAAKRAILLHGRDVKYTAQFTKLLEQIGLKPNPLPITKPNLNGRCEKFIGTIKHERLSRFIVFGNTKGNPLMSISLLDEPETDTTGHATERLRSTMAATKVSFTWFGVRKSLSPAQKERAADSFDAEAKFLSAAKKLVA